MCCCFPLLKTAETGPVLREHRQSHPAQTGLLCCGLLRPGLPFLSAGEYLPLSLSLFLSALLCSGSLAHQGRRSSFLPSFLPRRHCCCHLFSLPSHPLTLVLRLSDQQQTDRDSLFCLCGGDESANHWHMLSCWRSPKSQQRPEALFLFLLHLCLLMFCFFNLRIETSNEMK